MPYGTQSQGLDKEAMIWAPEHILMCLCMCVHMCVLYMCEYMLVCLFTCLQVSVLFSRGRYIEMHTF